MPQMRTGKYQMPFRWNPPRSSKRLHVSWRFQELESLSPGLCIQVFYAALQKASVWSCFSPIHSCLSPPPNLNSEEIICLLQQDGFCWKVNYSSSPGKHSPRPAASSLLHSMHSFFFFLSPTWWSHTAPATSLTTYYWQQRQSFLHPHLPQGIIRGTPISLSFAQQYME